MLLCFWLLVWFDLCVLGLVDFVCGVVEDLMIILVDVLSCVVGEFVW